VSWEADVWGKLRRGLEASEASAEASAADLAAMRLSQQSELVQNYLQLRVIDEQKRLLQATVEAYQRSLQMTENQYRAGVSGKDAWPGTDAAQDHPGQPYRPDLAARPVRKRHCGIGEAPADFTWR
jgi:outer membrane protein TolC